MLRFSQRSLALRLATIRLNAVPTPQSSSTSTSTAGSSSEEKPSQIPELKLDAATIEKLKIAEEIGEKAFEENTEILKKMMLRGLRALVIGIIGFVTFSVAMKRRRRLEEASKAVDDAEDPTLRYLEEMRSLGFDVDTLEEELEAEKKSKKKS
ncbi:membrane-associated protein, putative [Bodo saltans]|uniref:Membrane-associated protein, putative n=1 Tax=Bodo saltans TaxID=75058 RepID=A0A0S4KNG6_BODSA|nr:membrane-associated protein, putative [Bodo saltans]|eukprot:CUI15167.1 membrane-associated protein, putative [Bodo saltans]